MAYRQNNPLSRKTSPLKHDPVDARGGRWAHRHLPGGRVTAVQGKVLRGNEKFTKNTSKNYKSDDGSKYNASDMNLDYANSIANIYNAGAFSPGSVFTGGTYYNKGNTTGGKRGLFGLQFNTTTHGSTGVPKNLEIIRQGRSKGVAGQNMYNLGENWILNEETGIHDFKGDATNLVRPETQYTGQEIYDLMQSGNGMVSYIDGIGLVAGNPGEARNDLTDINELTWKNTDAYRRGDENYFMGDENSMPEGYSISEEVVEEAPAPIMSDREKMLADRKARILASRATAGPSRKSSSPFYKTGLKSSPLNQIDSRDGKPLEGYTYGEGVVGEKVPVYDDAGVQIGWSTDTEFSGTMNVPGVKEIPGTYDSSVTGGNPNPPGDTNPEGLSQEELNVNWTNYCLEHPTDPKCQGFNERSGITLPPTQVPTNEILSDVYTTTEFEPYKEEIIEEEIVEEKKPAFSIGTSNVGHRTGGKVKIKLPEIDLGSINPLNIVKIVGNTVFTKSGKCKAGCATNPNS